MSGEGWAGWRPEGPRDQCGQEWLTDLVRFKNKRKWCASGGTKNSDWSNWTPDGGKCVRGRVGGLGTGKVDRVWD